METKYIQEFLGLAASGNSYTAAEKLFISQSSLVRHIQTLEAEFQTTFFDRSRRGFVLNDDGRLFMDYVKRIALVQAECYRQLHPEKNENGLIRIGSACKTIDLVGDFKKEYPEYYVEYCRLGDMLHGLQTHQIDVGFISDLAAVPQGITSVRFCHEDMMVLVYEGHPLYEREQVRVEELRDEKFICLGEDTSFENSFADIFTRTGFIRNNTVTVLNVPDLVKMVRDGIGIAAIHGNPDEPVSVPGLRYVPIEPRLRHNVDLCYRTSQKEDSPAGIFTKFARRWIIHHENFHLNLVE